MTDSKTFSLQFKTDNSGAILGIKRVEHEVDVLGHKAKGLGAQFKALGHGFKEAGLDFVKNFGLPLGAAAIGGLVFETGKKVLEFDKSLHQLGRDASLSSKDLLGFGAQINQISMSTGTSREELLAMGSAAYKSSKDISFTKDSMTAMDEVMRATGASAESVGESFGEIKDKTKLSTKEVNDLVASMYSFGKTTGREQNLKDILPKTGELLRTFRAQFPEASFKQVQDYMLRSMSMENPEALKRMFIKTFSPEGRKRLKDLGLKTGATIDEIISAIKKKYKDPKEIQTAIGINFGKSMIEAKELLATTEEFARAKEEALKNPLALTSDAGKQAQELGQQFKQLTASLEVFGANALGPVMKQLGDDFKNMDPNTLKGIAEGFSAVGTAIAASVKVLGTFISLWSQVSEDVANWYFEDKKTPLSSEPVKDAVNRVKGYFEDKSKTPETFGADPEPNGNVVTPADVLSKINTTVNVYVDGEKKPSKTVIINTGAQFGVVK